MTPCEHIIRHKIATSGPISVEEFMEIALHHPQHGYYSRANAIGSEGDFITAPEISQLFGEVIGAWVVDTWQKLGSPSPFNLIELGPGRGTLMADALRVGSKFHGFMDACKLFLIERNTTLKCLQAELLATYTPKWLNDFHCESFADVPLIVIANEFFDAFPIKQFIARNNQWFERHVAVAKDLLAFQDIMIDTPPQNIEQSPQAEIYFHNVCKALAKRNGAFLTIDYGYDSPTPTHTLQAIKEHAHSNPLEAVGQSDLTSHVNFNRLKSIADELGLGTTHIQTQGSFLSSLGILERSQQLQAKNPLQIPQILSGMLRLIQPEQMGSLFKVLCVYSPKSLKPEGFP